MVNDLPVGAHAARLEAIRDIAQHAISILPAPEDEPLEEFNCIMHALGIVARLEHTCGRSPAASSQSGASVTCTSTDTMRFRPATEIGWISTVRWESGTVLAYLAGYVRRHGCGPTGITPVGT